MHAKKDESLWLFKQDDEIFVKNSEIMLSFVNRAPDCWKHQPIFETGVILSQWIVALLRNGWNDIIDAEVFRYMLLYKSESYSTFFYVDQVLKKVLFLKLC